MNNLQRARKRWYLANREEEIKRVVDRQAKRNLENTIRFIEYLKEHPCACGETDPLVLDFDHDDPTTKRIEVSKLRYNSKWETILKEIVKCTIRCANCHRRRTHKQSNSMKWQVVTGAK